MPKTAPRTKMSDLPWPGGGVSLHKSFTDQDGGTCVDALNVRTFDPTTNRQRGAQRCGYSRYVSGTLNGSAPIQNINHISLPAAVSGASVRSLKGVAVAGGMIRGFTSAGYTSTTGGAGALNASTPYISSAIFLQKVYYADGSNYVIYDPSTDTVSPWTASAGTLPVDGSNTPQLICTWRGRIVLARILGSTPQNWFMSAQFDATNWDFSPAIITATQAVAGNSSEAGLCPDIPNALVPYNDDLMLFGCDSSIYQMTNDPMAGGQFDRITDIVGMAFGDSWCKDSYGNIYFMGSRGGLYTMRPNMPPQRLSGDRVDERFLSIDFSKNITRLVWDDRFQTVHIYITPIAGGPTINWAYDIRNEAFWPDSFFASTMNASAVHLLDGDNPNDRAIVIGSLDGAIRKLDFNAKTDDGQPIVSYILLGPITSESKIKLRELRGILDDGSDSCEVAVLTGHSAQTAFNSQPRFKSVLGAGKNYAMRPLSVGQCHYVRISNAIPDTAWQLESLKMVAEELGLASGRLI